MGQSEREEIVPVPVREGLSRRVRSFTRSYLNPFTEYSRLVTLLRNNYGYSETPKKGGNIFVGWVSVSQVIINCLFLESRTDEVRETHLRVFLLH